MAELNNINNNLTYAELIKKAADSLYLHITENKQVITSNFRKDTFEITIGKNVICMGNSQEKKAQLTEIQNSNENFDVTTDIIQQDIVNFMNKIGILANENVTAEGLMSFFFALNYFSEKAIIEIPYSAENNSIQCKLQYKNPDVAEYMKIPFEKTSNNRITQAKITNLYNQIKSTSQLSKDARSISISSAAHTSSSCSSSCSSSAFIAYFNLG